MGCLTIPFFVHSFPPYHLLPPFLFFSFPSLLPFLLALSPAPSFHSLSLSSPKAAEKEAQLKEEKKQRKKSEYVERKTTAKQDHGGKRQQDAKWRDGGRREGGSEGGDREGKRGSGGRGEGGRGGRGEEGRGEGKGRKRAKAAHVYFDDSEEEKETPAKKQRGRVRG